jgi:hypothetical protein
VGGFRCGCAHRCCCRRRPAGGAKAGAGGISDAGKARRLLQQAFAEGDLLLCVNVPARWRGPRDAHPYASTRVGVLWNCTQVVAAGAASDGAASEAPLSWRASGQDLFGRSLPSQGYDSAAPVAGAFVAQDNTDKVEQGLAGTAAGGGAAATAAAGVPSSFTVQAGTLLADSALAADCEAVLQGRCSVAALQAWPATHPFAIADQLLVHTLVEGELGLPAWLAEA